MFQVQEEWNAIPLEFIEILLSSILRMQAVHTVKGGNTR